VRGDIADAELPEHLAEVGRVLRALEFFLEAPVRIIADEDAEAIAVEAHRQPGALGEETQEREIAVQILGGPEVEREDGPRGIVDGAEQEQGRAGAEPIERAAVDEDEGPAGGPPGAAGAVLRRAAAPLGGQAEAPAEPGGRCCG
jgi:hypothetical protein